jgi:hypothetical protein
MLTNAGVISALTIASANKIVVFDLDETLGYFVELGLFWDCLQAYIDKCDTPFIMGQQEFNSLLDLFPEFIRPNMFQILQYIQYKKNLHKCDKIMIYTNNQRPVEWAQYIKTYFEKKTSAYIFDQIINAFKVNGKYVELLRTTHKKTHDDLVKCTKLPQETQICFFDDRLHMDMCSDHIYYINLKPYIYKLQYETLITRFLKSENPTIKTMQQMMFENELDFKRAMLHLLNEYDYKYVKKNIAEYDMDKIISKKILHHLNTFFTPYKRSLMEQIVVLNNPAQSTCGPPSRRFRRRQNSNKTNATNTTNQHNKHSKNKSKTRKVRS